MNNTRIKILAESAALIAFMSIAGLMTHHIVPVLLVLIIYTAIRLIGHAAAKLFVEAEIIEGEYHEL